MILFRNMGSSSSSHRTYYTGYPVSDALATLTEILPQKHGGDQLWVLSPRPYSFLKLSQLLQG